MADEEFADARDAIASALNDIGSGLKKLGAAAEDFSGDLSGLAAAVAGSGSLNDAAERVAHQIGVSPPSEGEDWFDVIGDAIKNTFGVDVDIQRDTPADEPETPPSDDATPPDPES